MRRSCQSVAKATGTQCKKPSLPFSSYCFFHMERAPALVSAAIGAIASLIVAESWRHYVPSQELVELRNVRASVEPIQLLTQRLYPSMDFGDSVKELSHSVPKLLEANEQLLAHVKQLEEENTKKAQTIEMLQKDVGLARRGATVSYDYNGNRRESDWPGHIRLIEDTPESQQYLRFLELHNARDWKALALACETQIKANRNWLTPYMYLGVSYANLGQLEKASKNLQYVVDNAGDNKAYAEASKLLAAVKSKQHNKAT